MNHIYEFKFYGYTWMECFEGFYDWYESENKFEGKNFYETYPTFEDALKAYYEYINRGADE